jgi:hypothetical protein
LLAAIMIGLAAATFEKDLASYTAWLRAQRA